MGRGGWRKRRGRARRSGSEEDTSDEEFQLEEDDVVDASSEEVECSDASREECSDPPATSSGSSEVEEEEGDDDFSVANLKMKKVKGKRRKRQRPKKKAWVLEAPRSEEELLPRGPRGRKQLQLGYVVSDGGEDDFEDYDDEDFSPDEEDEEEEEPIDVPIKKKTVRRKRSAEQKGRRRYGVSDDEEDEFEDYDDEDFSPDEEEEHVNVPSKRKTVWRKGSAKQKGRKRKARDSMLEDEEEESKNKTERRKNNSKVTDTKNKKKLKKSVRKVRKRCHSQSPDDSDNDLDFIVQDKILTGSKNKTKKEKKSNGGRRRRIAALNSDTSDSNWSDFDYAVSEEKPSDPLVMNYNSQEQRTGPRTSKRDKGKGKEVEDIGKQVCGICLSEEQRRVVRGLLDSCAHFFCFPCILEWSKVESRCPVCKQRFTTITKSSSSNSTLVLRENVVRVPKRDQVYQPSEEEERGYLNPYENVVCMECQQGGDDELMLLCDLCDSPAHTYCVGHGRVVPEGNWYCDGCRSADTERSGSQAQDLGSGCTNNGDLQHPDGNGTRDSGGNMPLYATPERLVSQQERTGLDSPSQYSSIEYNGPGAASRASGLSALTLSGRRALHQHIRLLFSNNRMRTLHEVSSGASRPQFGYSENGIGNSEVEQRQETASHDNPNPTSLELCNEESQRNGHPIFRPSASIPRTGYGTSQL